MLWVLSFCHIGILVSSCTSYLNLIPNRIRYGILVICWQPLMPYKPRLLARVPFPIKLQIGHLSLAVSIFNAFFPWVNWVEPLLMLCAIDCIPIIWSLLSAILSSGRKFLIPASKKTYPLSKQGGFAKESSWIASSSDKKNNVIIRSERGLSQ